MNEKTRVSLPVGLWLSLVGIIVTGAGAWFATSAKADAASLAGKEHAAELRDHDRRLQRLEDAFLTASETLREVRDDVKELRRSGR